MKKIILLTMLLLQSVAIKLYAQNWSNWVTLSNNKGISASVSFLIRNGKSGGISFWKSNNNTYVKGGALFFSFDYIDDKGNPQTETTTTMIDLSKTGEVKDEGRSFVCNGGSITNIKVTSIYLPNDNTATNTNSVSTNSNSTSSNNSYNNNNNSSNRPLNFGTPQVNNSSNNSTYNHNQAVMNKLNNQLQTSQNVYNAVTGVLQQLQQQHDEKEQREQQEEAQREQEEQQQQAQLEEQQREEAQRQAEAAAAAYAETNRQWNTDRQTISNYLVTRKTSEIPGNIKIVYYITYERNYQTGKLFVRTYTLNKYSDGTWMFQNDLQNKIKFTPYLNSSGTGRLLGFFASKADALAALKQIKNNAPQANIDNSFLALNGVATQTTNNSDFWNQ